MPPRRRATSQLVRRDRRHQMPERRPVPIPMVRQAPRRERRAQRRVDVLPHSQIQVVALQARRPHCQRCLTQRTLSPRHAQRAGVLGAAQRQVPPQILDRDRLLSGPRRREPPKMINQMVGVGPLRPLTKRRQEHVGTGMKRRGTNIEDHIRTTPVPMVHQLHPKIAGLLHGTAQPAGGAHPPSVTRTPDHSTASTVTAGISSTRRSARRTPANHRIEGAKRRSSDPARPRRVTVWPLGERLTAPYGRVPHRSSGFHGTASMPLDPPAR
jgi:hypothetical protein